MADRGFDIPLPPDVQHWRRRVVRLPGDRFGRHRQTLRGAALMNLDRPAPTLKDLEGRIAAWRRGMKAKPTIRDTGLWQAE